MLEVKKENVIVREYTGEDFTSFVVQLCKNPKWTNVFELWNLDEENTIKFFSHHLDGYKDINVKEKGLMLGIFTKNGLLIGECGFEYNHQTNSVEVFIGLIEQARGKKFSHEALEALIEISKEIGINNVHANIPEAHQIALKLFDKSEFKFKNNYEINVNDMTVLMRHYVL